MLAKRLSDSLTLGSIRWLEVGVGDGQNLKYLLQALGGRRIFDVFAIDPHPTCSPAVMEGVSITLQSVRLEDFRLAGPYDCINARQSCYYFDEPERSVLKLACNLSERGILAVTVWTKKCALFELHSEIARSLGQKSEVVCAESIAEIVGNERFEVIERCQMTAPLASDAIQNEPMAANGLYQLAARKLDVHTTSEQLRVKVCREFFLQRPAACRENEVLLFRRRSADPA